MVLLQLRRPLTDDPLDSVNLASKMPTDKNSYNAENGNDWPLSVIAQSLESERRKIVAPSFCTPPNDFNKKGQPADSRAQLMLNGDYGQYG